MAGFQQKLKFFAVSLLRTVGLIEFADSVRMRLASARSAASKNQFVKRHPGIALPPDDLLYDAAGVLLWDRYWTSGLEAAGHLAGIIRGHLSGGKVLEWGCGPGRIIRHLPDALGSSFEVIGSDYNVRSIAWCASHLRGIRFLENRLMPPLALEKGGLACIYAISVFTHLSEEAHRAWIRHLFDVLQPGGLLIFSTHGDETRARLSRDEKQAYNAGKLVVRDKVLEGSRTFLAYQSPRFIRSDFLRDFEILSHGPSPKAVMNLQDLWVARKPAAAVAKDR